MADQPYTEADVKLVAKAIGREYPGLRDAVAPRLDADARAILGALAADGRLLPEGARAHGICGEHAPTLFGAGLDLQVCELTAGHKGWHGRPNGPGEPWMHWTEDMVIRESTDE